MVTGDGTVLYSSDAEAADDPAVYQGGCRGDFSTASQCSAGWRHLDAGATSDADHAYYLELRDRSGFDFDGHGQIDRSPLGFSAGLDFETKIFVKEKAPQLLREFLSKPRWQPEPITMSGVTDCYQPAERHFQLTRQCLEVALAARQPVTIVTKNALILRDLDILSEMATMNLVMVALSITSLDQSLTRLLEPRTSAPSARLRAVSELSAAGVPVIVLMAPLIPGLTDDEMAPILQAAAEHGAASANYTMLRLPLSVRPIFLDWLEQHAPAKKQRIEGLLRWIRDGQLNDAQFGVRMRGTGIMADQIGRLFDMLKKKNQLDRTTPRLDTSRFTPPAEPNGQMRLF